MKKYKAIIFDLDGTVLDTLQDLTSSLNHIFQLHELPEKTAAQVRTYLGYGYIGLMERAVPKDSPQALLEQLVQEFKTYYVDHCLIHTKPYDQIIGVIKTLRDRGYLTAVVSNKGQAAVSELDDNFFEGAVTFSIGESEKYHKKPAPDMIWEALKRLSTAPEDAIYIGDSEVDKETADNAHLDSVLVTWGFRDKPFLQSLHPTYLAERPDDLLRIFE